jgi:serine/threonine protein kinase
VSKIIETNSEDDIKEFGPCDFVAH